MYYNIIIIHLIIAYAHGFYYKHHTRMKLNKFHFNEHKKDRWKCDWLIGHIISIKNMRARVAQMMPNVINRKRNHRLKKCLLDQDPKALMLLRIKCHLLAHVGSLWECHNFALSPLEGVGI